MNLVRALLLSLIASLLLVSPAAAQSASGGIDFTQMDGYESGYGRIYALEASSLVATPEPGVSQGMVIFVIAFDSDEHAAAALEPYREQAASLSDEEKQKLAVNDVDLGDEGMSMVLKLDESDAAALYPEMSTVIARDGRNVFSLTSFNSSDVDSLTEILKAVIDAGVPDTEVTYKPEGGSTGGAFDAIAAGEKTPAMEPMIGAGDVDLTAEAAK